MVFLNHGSFGACPRPVLEEYQRWQRELERQPVEFLGRRWDELLGEARAALARYVGARPDDLVFVPNATTAMNTVARSLRLGPDDEVLTSEHEYGAIDYVWEATGASVVRRPLESLWDGVSERTRVLSIQPRRVADRGRRRRRRRPLPAGAGRRDPLGRGRRARAGPGARRPRLARRRRLRGQLPQVAVRAEGRAGFLWVREELQQRIDPLVVSWGWPKEQFGERHGWQGTRDPAAWLAVPAAIEFQREWGWDEVRERCHALAERFLESSGLSPAGRPFAQMVSVELPPCNPEEVQRRLREEHSIEVPCFERNGRALLRLSVQGYNGEEDVDRLSSALQALLS